MATESVKSEFKETMGGLTAYGGVDQFASAESIFLALSEESGAYRSFDLGGAVLEGGKTVTLANSVKVDVETVYSCLRADYAAYMCGICYPVGGDVTVAPDHKHVIIRGKCVLPLDDATLLTRIDKILDSRRAVRACIDTAREAAVGIVKLDCDDANCDMRQE